MSLASEMLKTTNIRKKVNMRDTVKKFEKFTILTVTLGIPLDI